MAAQGRAEKGRGCVPSPANPAAWHSLTAHPLCPLQPSLRKLSAFWLGQPAPVPFLLPLWQLPHLEGSSPPTPTPPSHPSDSEDLLPSPRLHLHFLVVCLPAFYPCTPSALPSPHGQPLPPSPCPLPLPNEGPIVSHLHIALGLRLPGLSLVLGIQRVSAPPCLA